MANPNFVKGNKFGVKGRPKGSTNLLPELLKAVKKVEGQKKKKLFEHFVERAYVNDKVLGALMSKLVANKQEINMPEPMTVNVKVSYGTKH